ncbi:unnamed protein product [Bursaphelenchus xylophilus]|uniref:(pine wood nematode) hypothetical protein n=1 Tax=Bursaphelenchus xylophilus TaxID=6326 RepID=A0A1I7SB32_BURXY|nr:unnamed protein product [Bursaphelenchus xylophilus]CAG9131711.1 unnamed protein product [Bursaphelenchus xylophilus]
MMNVTRPQPATKNARARFRHPIEGYDEAEGVFFVDRRGNNIRGIKCRECGQIIRRNMCGLHRLKHGQPSPSKSQNKRKGKATRKRREAIPDPPRQFHFQYEPPQMVNLDVSSMNHQLEVVFPFGNNALVGPLGNPNVFGQQIPPQNAPQMEMNNIIHDEDEFPALLDGQNELVEAVDLEQPRPIPVVELSVPVPNNPPQQLHDPSVDGSGYPIGHFNPEDALRQDPAPVGPATEHVAVGEEGDNGDIPAWLRHQATVMFWGPENDENLEPRFG